MALCLVALSSTLSSCSFFANDDWKKEFGTPDLFLQQIGEDHAYIYPYGDLTAQVADTGLEIGDVLKQSGPYTESKQTSSPSEKFFAYQNFLSHSTAGPNYCMMSVYDDGFIKIDHKSALGPHQFAYFEMEKEKASYVIELALAKVKRYQEESSSGDAEILSLLNQW